MKQTSATVDLTRFTEKDDEEKVGGWGGWVGGRVASCEVGMVGWVSWLEPVGRVVLPGGACLASASMSQQHLPDI